MKGDAGAIVVMLAALAVMMFGAHSCDRNRREACERAGGEYVVLYKSSVCLRPGSIVEVDR